MRYPSRKYSPQERLATPEHKAVLDEYKKEIDSAVPLFNPATFAQEEAANKPFNPATFAQEESPGGEPGKVKSAAAGVSQAVTFGYTPQIVGAMTELFKPKVIDPKTGEPITEPYSYLKNRDETTKSINKSAEANPWTYGGANLIANLAIPAGAGAKGYRQLLYPALYGAASNPGDVEGQINPFQVDDRFFNALTSSATSGATNLVGRGVGAAGRAGRTASAMDKPRFERGVRKQITSAADDLHSKYVTPRAIEARKSLKVREITIDPRTLEGAEMEGLRKALLSRSGLADKAKATGGFVSGDKVFNRAGIEVPTTELDRMVTLRGDVADRVRRKIEHDSYKKKTALATPELKASEARRGYAANRIREARDAVAPELQNNFTEQSYAINLRKDLKNQAAAPQAALTGGFWSDQGAKLTDVDSFAGTKLRQKAADIMRARVLKGQPQAEMAGWQQIPSFLSRMALNTGAQAARPLNRAGEALSPLLDQGAVDAIIKTILDQQRLSPGGQR